MTYRLTIELDEDDNAALQREPGVLSRLRRLLETRPRESQVLVQLSENRVDVADGDFLVEPLLEHLDRGLDLGLDPQDRDLGSGDVELVLPHRGS